jgi:hypothetical protein
MAVATSLVAEQTHVNLQGGGLHPGQTKAVFGQRLPKRFYRHFHSGGIQSFIQWLCALLHAQIFLHRVCKLSIEKIVILSLSLPINCNMFFGRHKGQSLTFDMWNGAH